MSKTYAPCDDCGKPVEVTDDWPLDYAYCESCEPGWAKRNLSRTLLVHYRKTHPENVVWSPEDGWKE